MRTAFSIVTLLCSSLLSWPTSGQQCPDPAPGCPLNRQKSQNLLLYTSTQAGSIAASSIFCGNGRKYGNNSVDASNLDLIDPGNEPWCTAPKIPLAETCGAFHAPLSATTPCINSGAANPSDPGAVSNPAAPVPTEKAEIRGWVSAVEGSADNGEEYVFYIILDVGWCADAVGVTALNSLALLAQYIPPANIIAFGGRAFDSSGYAWGGANRVQIKVEIDGWGASRACYSENNPPYSKTSTGEPCPYNYLTHNPYSYDYTWNTTSTDYNPIFPVYWPFPRFPPDNTALVPDSTGTGTTYPAPGDYVRLVGTLWLDGLHIGDQNVPAAVQSAERCWNNVHSPGHNWGWLEMHPVDYLAKICPPSHPHTVVGYALCNDSGDTSFVYEALQAPTNLSIPPELRMRDAPAFPNSLLNVAKVTQSFWSPPQGLNHSVYTITQPQKVQFDINGQGNSSTYWSIYDLEFYDLFYSCTPSSCGNTCNISDGCGGTTCSGNHCNPGNICPANGIGTCVPALPPCVTSLSASNVEVNQGGNFGGSPIRHFRASTYVTPSSSSGAENFTLSGLPPGVTSFSCTNCPVTQGNSATINLGDPTSATPPGNYNVTVTGTSPGCSNVQTTFVYKVDQPQNCGPDGC